jgi:hypothetical protein
VNTFGYVGQSPLVLADPTGRNPATAAEGGYVVGGLVGAAIDYGLAAATGVAGLTLGTYVYDITHPDDGSTTDSSSTNDSCKDDNNCAYIQSQIEHWTIKVRGRYNAMLTDEHRLFGRGKVPGIGSWAGHRQKYLEIQGTLRSWISQAKIKGCPYDQGADYWAAKAPPGRPDYMRY